jgi:hypothetical protein
MRILYTTKKKRILLKIVKPCLSKEEYKRLKNKIKRNLTIAST